MGSHPQHIIAMNTAGSFFDCHIHIQVNFDVFFAQVGLQGNGVYCEMCGYLCLGITNICIQFLLVYYFTLVFQHVSTTVCHP
jgi:hypothetical protein